MQTIGSNTTPELIDNSQEDSLEPMDMQDEPMPEDGMSQSSQKPQPYLLEPELVNLAEHLEEEELKKIGSDIVEKFNNDLDSRSEWETMHEGWLKLYYQTDISENPPWNGASEESLPDLTEAVNQFQSRTYKAFFPNRFFIDAMPVGKSNKDASDRAERIGRHMSYQLGVLDRTYKRNKNQMFMACALHGSDFTKTYFSPTKKRIIVERVRASDLIIPYKSGPRSIEEIERKTHIKMYSINEVAILHKAGWFIDTAKNYNNNDERSNDSAVADAEGLNKGNIWDDRDGECHILECHCLLDLDDDDISEPYVVWVDRQSHKVLRIQIRYEVDESGLPLNNKEPIEHFTHYQFLPNPEGFYGLGMGHLIGKLNKAGNKLIRMFIDANELYTVGNMTHLISDGLGIKGDEFDLSMGRGIKFPRSVDDIRKHFVKLDFDPPSAQTLQMVELIQARIQRLSSNTDMLSGQPDKVYQPTAMLSMIEQGLQLFSSVQEFIGVSMEDELQKVFRLNAKYLDEQAYYLDGNMQVPVTKQDYADDFRVIPVFDPKYTTRSQKLAKAQAVYEFILQNPLTAQNQQSLYEASKSYLTALDIDDLQQILPEPQANQTVRIDDQNLENTYFLMPPEKRPLFDVFPDQDHVKHIQMIDRMIEWADQSHPLDVPNPPMGDPQISKLLSTLGNDQKQELIANLLRHRSLHVAYMFGQLNGVMNEQGQPLQSGQGHTSDMAQTPSDNPDVESLVRAISTAPDNQNMPNGESGILPRTS